MLQLTWSTSHPTKSVAQQNFGTEPVQTLLQSISSQGGHWLLVPMAQGAIGTWLLGPFAIVGGVRRYIASPLFIRPSAGSTGSPASAPCARARAVKARHPPRPPRAPAPASPAPAASSAVPPAGPRAAGPPPAAASALQGGGGGCPAARARSSAAWRWAMASSSSVMRALRGSQSEGVPSSSPNDGPSPPGRRTVSPALLLGPQSRRLCGIRNQSHIVPRGVAADKQGANPELNGSANT